MRSFITLVVTAIAAAVASFAICNVADAQTTCLEDAGPNIDLPTTVANPAQFTTDCLCFNWDAGTGTVDHYHFFASGVIMGSPAIRAQQFCMPAKNTVYKIDVEAVSPVKGAAVSPISDAYYVRWVDIDTSQVCSAWEPAQCVNQYDRVVPCP
jgi:hypothetical protein